MVRRSSPIRSTVFRDPRAACVLRGALQAAAVLCVGVLAASVTAAADTALRPGLLWTRYLGGAGREWVSRVVADGDGNVWVAGSTADPASWETDGVTPLRIGAGGNGDVFLARFDAGGSLRRLIILGGSGDDSAQCLTIGPDGSLMVAGNTRSADFPTTPGSLHPEHFPGYEDVFVAKLTPEGELLWSTHLDGTPADTPVAYDRHLVRDMALLPNGSVAVVGYTGIYYYGMWEGPPPDFRDDGFLVVLSADGSTLELLLPLTGSDYDDAYGVAVDGDENIVVAGYTRSADFPLVHPYRATPGPGFVVKVAWPSGDVVFSTYLDGVAESLAIDVVGRPVVVGRTSSADFPVTPGALSSSVSGVFMIKLAADGSSLVTAARLPFDCSGQPRSVVAIDADDRIWIAGSTDSRDVPLVTPLQGATSLTGENVVGPDGKLHKNFEGFLSVLTPDASALAFSTYLRGSTEDQVGALAFTPGGEVVLAGITRSADLPRALGSYSGDYDGFVARLTTTAPALATSAAVEPASGPAPLVVGLTATPSGGTGLYTYDWDYGDGTMHSMQPAAYHVYTIGGAYTATLTVTDSAGATASASAPVTVEAACTVGCAATVPLMTSALGATTLQAVPFSATAAPSSDCPLTPSFLWDFGDGATSTEQNPSHTYPAPGIYGWSLIVTLGDNTCRRQGTVTVTGLSTVASLQIVPATAHNPGLEGTLWRTDLTAVNRGPSPAALALVYATGEGSTLRSASVPAGGTVEWPDVLATLFGVDPGATSQGTLQIASDRPVALVARTYDETTAGTLGAAYPALGPQDGIAFGAIGVLPGLKSSAGFRTNLGLVNLAGSDCDARVTLHRVSGLVAGTPLDLALPAGQWVPLNDVFARAGAGPQDLAYATVEPVTPGSRVWAYASVVDNGTGDPTMVPLVVYGP